MSLNKLKIFLSLVLLTSGSMVFCNTGEQEEQEKEEKQ